MDGSKQFLFWSIFLFDCPFYEDNPSPPFFFYQNGINMHFHKMHHTKKHGLELLCLYLLYVTAVQQGG